MNETLKHPWICFNEETTSTNSLDDDDDDNTSLSTNQCENTDEANNLLK